MGWRGLVARLMVLLVAATLWGGFAWFTTFDFAVMATAVVAGVFCFFVLAGMYIKVIEEWWHR